MIFLEDVVELKVKNLLVTSGNVIVRSTVPLANMFGYATDLRSNTQGRGTFSMEFKCYEQVPRNVEEEIISKSW